MENETHVAAGIECRLVRARRKTLAIEIRAGEPIIKAPLYTPLAVIETFVASRKAWITEKIDAYFIKYRTYSDVLSYRTLLLSGVSYPVQPSVAIRSFRFTGTCFLVPSEKVPTEKLAASVRRWYKRYAAGYLQERLKQLAAASGLCFASLDLTDAKGKWGSCDAKNNIRLNWRLTLLSPFLQEYVLLHELCHTQYHNHSKDFWNLVQKLFPSYKKARKQLKDCSILIDFCRA